MKISARRSVTSLCDIKKSEILSNENLGMRRPGDGISTAYLDEIIGKKALKEIKKGSKIQFGDFG